MAGLEIKRFQSGQVTLINNAIQAEKFSFQKKTEIHSERNWDGKIKQ